MVLGSPWGVPVDPRVVSAGTSGGSRVLPFGSQGASRRMGLKDPGPGAQGPKADVPQGPGPRGPSIKNLYFFIGAPWAPRGIAKNKPFHPNPVLRTYLVISKYFVHFVAF